MMQPELPLIEDALRDERDKLRRRARRQRWAIIALTCLAVALAATTAALAVMHANFARRCGPYVDPSLLSADPSVPQAPPLGRRSGAGAGAGGLVVVPVVARAPPLTAPSSKDTIDAAPLPVERRTSLVPPPYPITNGTNGSSPDAGAGAGEGREQCEPGSVWGGRELDELDHGYMALMEKALSVSPPGVAGEFTDYFHTALRSVFLCGQSMELGQLELVAACRSGYVGEGEEAECDEGGSYGGDSASASV